MKPFWMRVGALLVGAGAGLASGACATAAPSVTEGHQLSDAMCARCHVAQTNGPASWTDAPSLESIANRPGITRAWLADFIPKPHAHMLTADYTPAQAQSIAAYIMSLRHR